MLIYFSVSNYKSFRDKAEFNMIAANSHDSKMTQDHVFRGYTPPLLRTSAIYGSNGAGKSNFLDALKTIKRIVCGNYHRSASYETIYYKLDPTYKEKPTEFETEFMSNGNRYVYHLAMIMDRICFEWLTNVDNNGIQTQIFSRELIDGKDKVTMPSIEGDEKEKIRLEVYSEELGKRRFKTFLEYGADRGIEELEDAYAWFDKQLEVVKAGTKLVDRLSFFSNPQMRKMATDMIHALDLRIQDIKVVSVPFDDMFSDEFFPKGRKQDIKEMVDSNTSAVMIQRDGLDYQIYKDDDGNLMAGRIILIHNKGNEFELSEESTGTRMILDMIPAFISSIIGKKTIIFDEIEVNKHPELTKELIMIYLIAGGSHEGQLVFTTHECNLLDLDILRPDEIWFVEKDDDEASHIYSLSDFKPQYPKDIKRGYLEGMFSRIPFFADPKQLKWYGNTDATSK